MKKSVEFKNVELLVPEADRPQSLKSLLLNFRKLNSKKKTILSIPHFTAHDGDKICIVGRNGNGKTTFLKVLAGIYPVTRGIIWTEKKPTVVLAAGIGLEEELSVIENINLSLIIKNVKKSDIPALAESILEFCELKDDRYKQYKHLSTGFKSRLAFAIAVSEKPDILILDEVLGGGDEFFMKKANAKLIETINVSSTAFIATHAPDQMQGICNRLVMIEKGQILFDGAFEEGVNFYRNSYV
ncbi:O97 family O-antigen ABC transporter ATP-binding protein Wzt [Escherichia coli]|uniref:O-antigen export system, ATP-binding protein n=2 Tax=Escherichia coli TaxID=562 RepID=A0A0A8J627_ECOLX|nr:O97 family O-antigen export ABC transporter ATP-binding subunit [Escherichia coli]AIG62859.1 O-antigen export system, ATP-binding protein [Escherichia coli]EFL6449386.1 O97 family O-antigen ABC transporter ATP-binding protein Wzt [Escherichia coli]EZJ85386.1 ABC transporter family protein [Escherichia coli 1-250-04_S3_C1]KEO32884.1 ABC transporter family protein [Escherichia coli 1-250-04_S3_C2]MCH0687079.1 O97 family O-antigen ABC transporter ATP-binding protein Wzt [Escherichia coli]